jgi:hypothetical protein
MQGVFTPCHGHEYGRFHCQPDTFLPGLYLCQEGRHALKRLPAPLWQAWRPWPEERGQSPPRVRALAMVFPA